MKRKLIYIIVILFVFIVGLSINKYYYEKNLYYFYIYDINNMKVNTDEDKDIQDHNLKNISISDIKSLNYNYRYQDTENTGKIYISDDMSLHILDTIKNVEHVISDVKFKSIYLNNYGYENGIKFYAISEDNNLYLISLNDNNVNNALVEKMNGVYTDFVDVKIKKDKYRTENSVFAIGQDEYIYNVNNGLLYIHSSISLYNKIYVYDDNTMVNVYGKVIDDKYHVPYKIKYIFNVVLEDVFIDNTSYIIITEDNKFLYFNDDFSKVYELNRKVEKVEFERYDPYIGGVLTLTLNMNSKMYFYVECNEYYCVN